MTTAHEFGARLKRLRERRGITLEAIAETTKIAAPLLSALERDDVSRWPHGIYRRAFFRDYAAAIDAPVEEMLSEFMRLFPEDPSETSASGPGPVPALRMTLSSVASPARVRATRIAAALADAGFVILLGLATAWFLAADRSTAIALAGLVYYPLTTGWLGRSLAQSWLPDVRPMPRAWRIERRTANVEAMAESAREEWRVAGVTRERRTGVDRRRIPRMVDESDTAPIEGLFGLRKGSAA